MAPRPPFSGEFHAGCFVECRRTELSWPFPFRGRAAAGQKDERDRIILSPFDPDVDVDGQLILD